MSLDNTGCPAAIDPCDFTYPSQYRGTTVGAEIEAHLDTLACAANDSAFCGVFDCDTATGEILTMIGNRVGWLREHCNVTPVDFFGFDCEVPPPVGTGCTQASVVGLCNGAYFFCRLDGSSNYTFDDDGLYRSFVKAAIVKNRARRFKELSVVKLVNEIVKALWGNDAWVVSADNGEISVSAGRDLTENEVQLLSLYERVICVGLGIRLSIFCTAPFKQIGCNFPPEFIKTAIECNNPDTGAGANSNPTFIKTTVECNNP